MSDKMPCSVSDGPQTPEDVLPFWSDEDEDEAYERLRQERIDDKIAPMDLTGWSSTYYELPPGATELQDLIEHREMNFAVANIFKAAYRLGHKTNTSAEYDLDKIIWFAEREKARLQKQRKEKTFEKIQSDTADTSGKGNRSS